MGGVQGVVLMECTSNGFALFANVKSVFLCGRGTRCNSHGMY